MTRRTHEQLKKAALSRPGVKKEYDALEEEFLLLDEMLKARVSSGKTQDDVAKIMKTTTSVVGRLETGGGKHSHSPTIATLRKYASAVNCSLRIVLVQEERRPKGVTMQVREGGRIVRSKALKRKSSNLSNIQGHRSSKKGHKKHKIAE
jgi:transcriptional regulator with XRE-family HTH domain